MREFLAMLGKTNSNMGGKAAAAAYVFENATMSKSYPVDEMTEAGWKTFPFNYVDDLEGFKASRYEFATYCTAYGGGWIPWFDNDFSTSTNLAQPKYFKFGEPVLLKKIKIAGDAQTLKIYATNEADYLGDTSLMTLAKEVEVPSSAASLIELEVDADAAYMYYMFENDSNYSGIKELRWEVVGGNVSCTLSSANMTPEIRAYLTDYMRLITQPFYCEGKVIPSQTLVMKPYEEGGNLINYTDDGSAVDLKIFYGKSGGEPASKKYVQPLLSANGTLGGNDPACSGTSEQTPAYYAFDGNTETKWQTGTSSTPQSVVFYDPDGFVPTGAVISFVNGEVYASGEVFGSNDNSDWVSLTTFADNELDTLTLSFANDTEYKYIKFQFNSLFSGWGQIYEIKINGVVRRVPADMYFIAPNADSLPEGYVSAQIVADLSLPAHIYKNAGGEWVMGKTD
jgi:F5/8 type C domain|nr:MAG TPA: F5/8 type C domain [Caudoviricetes sp.]